MLPLQFNYIVIAKNNFQFDIECKMLFKNKSCLRIKLYPAFFEKIDEKKLIANMKAKRGAVIYEGQMGE